MNKYVTTIPVEYMQERPDYYLYDGTGWLYSPPAGDRKLKESEAVKQAAKLGSIRKMKYEVLKVRELIRNRIVYLPVRLDHHNKWVEYLSQLGNYELLNP